jgi:acetylglutamate synthase
MPITSTRQFSRSSGDILRSTRSIVLQLLGDIRSEREARQYFSGLNLDSAKECILIRVGSSIVTKYLDSLVSSLALLSRVGIYPIVVHDVVSQIDKMLETADDASRSDRRIQVTDAPMLALMRSAVLKENLKLVEALEDSETRCWK